jgi:MerR family transcriptional regulator, copper efflux regulator
MYIGELSKITGISIKAIRLYEEKGLLPEVGRSGQYRVYNHRHARVIELIKEAKALGFKLSEMRRALDAGLEENIWRSILHAIRCKKREIEQEIMRLDGIASTLAKHEQSIDACLAENSDCDLPP